MNKLEKQLSRFIKSGFKRSRFTKDLYNALHIDSNMFIAHFNIDGFYEIRFMEEAENTIEMLRAVRKSELRDLCQTLASAMELNLRHEVFVERYTKVGAL